jgi:UDP-glucose 4-epimerase
MPSILITGGAGFIGSNAAEAFRKKGYVVSVLDDLSLGWKENLDPSIRFVKGDVSDSRLLNEIGPVDMLVHLAASSSAPMFQKDLPGSVANNVLGHLSVLEFAKRVGVKKILFASTATLYGNTPGTLSESQEVIPPNYYSVTKRAQEDISRVFSAAEGMEIIAFRFMSVYGPHEEHKGQYANLVSQFMWAMEEGRSPVIYGDGMQTRDFTNVRDIIQAFTLALESEKRFGFTIFNVGTGESFSLIDLVNTLNTALGTAIQPAFIPNPIQSGYILTQQADLSKISRELGYAPTVTLADGIRELVEARKMNPVRPRSMSF